MRGNMDQKNSEYGHFWRSEYTHICLFWDLSKNLKFLFCFCFNCSVQKLYFTRHYRGASKNKIVKIAEIIKITTRTENIFTLFYEHFFSWNSLTGWYWMINEEVVLPVNYTVKIKAFFHTFGVKTSVKAAFRGNFE